MGIGVKNRANQLLQVTGPPLSRKPPRRLAGPTPGGSIGDLLIPGRYPDKSHTALLSSQITGECGCGVFEGTAARGGRHVSAIQAEKSSSRNSKAPAFYEAIGTTPRPWPSAKGMAADHGANLLHHLRCRAEQALQAGALNLKTPTGGRCAGWARCTWARLGRSRALLPQDQRSRRQRSPAPAQQGFKRR